ncbi:diguanylate cyclase [Sagittula sp. SSi028]|uniref:GGDEF domain-containing protein n=1 Tax=Sagittula sp. SSi028 TaxID=3400636 RepID=UPI003AF9D847
MPGSAQVHIAPVDPTCASVRAVFRDHHEAVILTDTDHITIWANAVASELTGFAPDELIGLEIEHILPRMTPGDTVLLPQQTGQQRTFVHKTGLRIEAEITTWPFLRRDRSLCGHLTMLKDRSREHRIAQARRAMFDLIVDQTPTAAEKINDLLRIACELLCMPVGIVAQQVGDTLTVLHSRSTLTPPLTGCVYPARLNDCAAKLDSPAPVLHQDDSILRAHPLLPDIDVQCSLGVRLSVGGSVFGVLNFLTPLPRTAYMPVEQDFLADLGAMVAQLLAQDQQRLALETAASMDWLTGAASIRQFRSDLEQTLALARRNDSDATLILFDIDHFKAVNDSHGHDVGDRVLSAMAELTRATIGSYLQLYRIGGEEFAILLPGSRGDAAAILAEQLRTTLATESQNWRELPNITASFGVAELDQDQTSAEGWLKTADVMLYASKHAGRNRVTSNRLLSGIELPDHMPPLKLHQRAPRKRSLAR